MNLTIAKIHLVLHSKNTKEMIAIWERDQFGYPVCIDEKHVSGFWRCGGES